MTVMIFSKTTSSPEESLVSNLQCDTVLLSSIRAGSSDGAFKEMRPQTKKLCRDERAAEDMGPVDNGDRIMEKKGDRRVVNGKCVISIANSINTWP
jgi:hypothetical protein